MSFCLTFARRLCRLNDSIFAPSHCVRGCGSIRYSAELLSRRKTCFAYELILFTLTYSWLILYGDRSLLGDTVLILIHWQLQYNKHTDVKKV